jgi:hypothetical protein
MLTLHKLPEGFIVTSDEGSKKGELTIFPSTENGRIVKLNTPKIAESNYAANGIYNLKVLTQQDQIDFSALKEEEQKEIGWFDVEKIQKEKFLEFRAMITETSEKNLFEIGIREGFQKAQELLSDRRFTLEDMKKSFIEGSNVWIDEDDAYGSEFNNEMNQYIESIAQPKSWEIEVEMEIVDGCNCKFMIDNGLAYNIGNKVIGTTCSERNRCTKPKFTNGKIKILKIK